MNADKKEQKTIIAMIDIYCRGNHKGQPHPCPDCTSLLNYAKTRIEKCPWGAMKPTCARCTIHCYEKLKREQIITIMRFSGPKMAIRHPFLTLLHLLSPRSIKPSVSRKSISETVV